MGLHFNQFTGSIPWEQLCNIMPLLSFLLLNSNKFNRPILTAISNCTQLQTIFLADNKLSCPLPHQLGKLKKFQNLFAGNKQLTDPLPKELDNLPISNQMDISHNNINLTGLIPSNYGRNVDPDLDISIVDFSNNMLTGIFKILRCLDFPYFFGNLFLSTILMLTQDQTNGFAYTHGEITSILFQTTRNKYRAQLIEIYVYKF